MNLFSFADNTVVVNITQQKRLIPIQNNDHITEINRILFCLRQNLIHIKKPWNYILIIKLLYSSNQTIVKFVRTTQTNRYT